MSQTNGDTRHIDNRNTVLSTDTQQPTLDVATVAMALSPLRQKWQGFQAIHVVQTQEELPESVSFHAGEGGMIQGVYDPVGNAVWIVADAIATPAEAVWVAAHEVVGHGGLRMLRDRDIDAAVTLASSNTTVRSLASAIGRIRQESDPRINIEEALAELAAVRETGSYRVMREKYGVDVPLALREGVIGTVARACDAVGRFMRNALGRHEKSADNGTIASLLQQVKRAVISADVVPAGASVGDQAPRFMFVGQRSAVADQFSLERAKQLLNQNRFVGSVRSDTGWFPGIDGKWRYEIPDDEAVLVNCPVKEDLTAYIERKQIARFGKRVNPADLRGSERDEYDLFHEAVAKSYDAVYRDRLLSELLHHPKLYAAYPDLAYVVVSFDREEGSGGTYYGHRDAIRLEVLANASDALSLLLHEVQHAVQLREKFARGGNNSEEFIKSVMDGLTDAAGKSNAAIATWKWENRAEIASAEQAATTARYGYMFESAQRLLGYAQRPEPSGVLRLIRNEIQWIHDRDFHRNSEAREISAAFYATPKRHKMRERNEHIRAIALRGAKLLFDHIPQEVLQKFESDPRSTKGLLSALSREADKTRKVVAPLSNLERSAESIKGLLGTKRSSSSYEVYRSLAGEVEARNTQARLKMTAEERRQTSPGTTQDVQDHEIIVLFRDMDIRAPLALCNLELENVLEQGSKESLEAKRGAVDASHRSTKRPRP